MQVPNDRKIELAAEALERIVHCPENSYRKTLLGECVSAYLPLDDEQQDQFENMVRHHPDAGVQAMQLGFLDHVKLEGQRELLCKQLEVRFGPLPSSVVARLDAWPGERLTELAGALLSAESLKELGLGESATAES